MSSFCDTKDRTHFINSNVQLEMLADSIYWDLKRKVKV